jgi:tRNA uridine 5-carbamoylmethylation protein Kti12
VRLVLLYGPPAVGKLTIAKVLANKIDYKLLHNHLIVNPIAEIFPFEWSAMMSLIIYEQLFTEALYYGTVYKEIVI